MLKIKFHSSQQRSRIFRICCCFRGFWMPRCWFKVEFLNFCLATAKLSRLSKTLFVIYLLWCATKTCETRVKLFKVGLDWRLETTLQARQTWQKSSLSPVKCVRFFAPLILSRATQAMTPDENSSRKSISDSYMKIKLKVLSACRRWDFSCYKVQNYKPHSIPSSFTFAFLWDSLSSGAWDLPEWWKFYSLSDLWFSTCFKIKTWDSRESRFAGCLYLNEDHQKKIVEEIKGLQRQAMRFYIFSRFSVIFSDLRYLPRLICCDRSCEEEKIVSFACDLWWQISTLARFIIFHTHPARLYGAFVELERSSAPVDGGKNVRTTARNSEIRRQGWLSPTEDITDWMEKIPKWKSGVD